MVGKWESWATANPDPILALGLFPWASLLARRPAVNLIFWIMSDLTFGRSTSLSAFKAENGGEAMKIVRNPKTGKIFFSCGDKKGAVAAKTAANGFKGDLRVCEVTDGRESFLLLCDETASNVITTL